MQSHPFLPCPALSYPTVCCAVLCPHSFMLWQGGQGGVPIRARRFRDPLRREEGQEKAAPPRTLPLHHGEAIQVTNMKLYRRDGQRQGQGQGHGEGQGDRERDRDRNRDRERVRDREREKVRDRERDRDRERWNWIIFLWFHVKSKVRTLPVFLLCCAWLHVCTEPPSVSIMICSLVGVLSSLSQLSRLNTPQSS